MSLDRAYAEWSYHVNDHEQCYQWGGDHFALCPRGQAYHDAWFVAAGVDPVEIHEYERRKRAAERVDTIMELLEPLPYE